jgi:hypothetical protein
MVVKPNCTYCDIYQNCLHPNKPKLLFFFTPTCNDMYETCILKNKHPRPIPPRMETNMPVPTQKIILEIRR